jgi:chaperone modulatory protein CbpM
MKMNLDEFLANAQIERVAMQRWFEMQWIVTPEAAMPREISDIDAARALLIHELTSDFGVNDEGVDIVLHLLDQLHGLRQVLIDLRTELHGSAGGQSEPLERPSSQ